MNTCDGSLVELQAVKPESVAKHTGKSVKLPRKEQHTSHLDKEKLTCDISKTNRALREKIGNGLTRFGTVIATQKVL